MGRLAERLDDIRVRVREPGADIEAELSSRSNIALSFGESVYEFISERYLEGALARLARLLFVGWLREYKAAIADTELNIDPKDQHDLNFRDECRKIESSGESSDGRIRLSAVGMNDFTARIRRGTVRELREREFVARFREAPSALLEDYRAQVRELIILVIVNPPLVAARGRQFLPTLPDLLHKLRQLVKAHWLTPVLVRRIRW